MSPEKQPTSEYVADTPRGFVESNIFLLDSRGQDKIATADPELLMEELLASRAYVFRGVLLSQLREGVSLLKRCPLIETLEGSKLANYMQGRIDILSDIESMTVNELEKIRK